MIPGLSNYPQGFGNGVTIRGLPVLNTHGGSVFWVDSATGGDGNRGTFDRPFSTLDYAIGRCTANHGDIIMLKENHAETITGASGITGDIAGITIIGLGTYNQRPRFLMDGGTSVSFVISAADTTVQNCVFASGHSNVVTCFDITAKGATLLGLEFENNTTNEDFLTPIKVTSTTSNAGDGLKVVGCRWLTTDVDDLEFIEINGDLRGLVVHQNFICTSGTASPLILSAGTKDLTAARITENILQSAGTANDLMIDNGGSGNTGIVAYNLCGNLDVTGAQVFGVATGLQFFQNFMTSTSTESGGLQLTADTPNS